MAFDFTKGRRIQSLRIQNPRLASQMICLNSDVCVVKILGYVLLYKVSSTQPDYTHTITSMDQSHAMP